MSRVPSVLMVVGLILAGVAGGCGGDARAMPRESPTRGVAIDITLTEPATSEIADLDAAADLGVDAVRVAVQWAGMEPLVQGQYASAYLERLDGLIARAKERGVQVLLTPVFTPCWAATAAPGAAPPCADPSQASALGRRPPADPATYAAFAAFLAQRYDPQLAGLEVWNEPNLPGFWETATPAEDYAALLAATYPAVKQAAPGVPVVGGVLSGADADFLRKLYESGISGNYDVLSLHLYNDGRPPEARIPEQFSHASLVQGMREVQALVTEQRESKPIWITELGWNTSSQRGQPFLDGVTPEEQAAYLMRAIAMLQDPDGEIDFARAVFIYRLRDTGPDPADPQQNYGLMSFDRQPKPALDAVRSAFARPFGSQTAD